MENAPLTKAHEHVRNASAATYGNSTATAGEAHVLAAESFQEAARDTHDAEALRILGLLQDHHLTLARLIKEPPRNKDKASDGAPQLSDPTASPPSQPSSTPTSRPASPPTSAAAATRAPSRRRPPHSSIASNLAEKRGIPGARRGTPTASPVSVTNALATRSGRQSTPVRDLLQQQSIQAEEAAKQKDAGSSKQKDSPTSRSTSPPPDDNFRRFYSAFGGMINALSAPLAFTSLPLSPGAPSINPKPESSPPSPTEQKSKPKPKPKTLDASRTIKSSEPDLASLISKPALHALREDPTGPLGPFANNESFYFVPTSGGTVSYASIVRDPQAHPHHAAQDPHLDSIAEGDDTERAGIAGLRGSSHEEFVDARESIGPPSPTPRRPRSKGSATTTAVGVTSVASIRAGRGTGLKTMEELQLENETLRTLIDKQAKRLSMWETTSQNSYNALAQSFRARGVGAALKQHVSDPSALAHALAGATGTSSGANTLPGTALTSSTPPVPSIPPQYRQPPSSPSPTTTTTTNQDQAHDTATAKRIADLEALLASQTTQLDTLTSEKQNLARQNEKNAQVIGRYREQWEKLKAGARKKEQERREREREKRVDMEVDGKDGAGTGLGPGLGPEGGLEGKEDESVSGENDVVQEEQEGVALEDEAGAGFGKA